MAQVISKDGTKIAYDKTGSGPAVILVDGALCYRGFGPMGGLAPLLEPRFTVIRYDRRGRGESGDTLPYAVEREIEDINALIQVAGGSACVYGTSSGAALAMRAAAAGLNIIKLALYEPPFNPDPGMSQMARDYTKQLKSVLAEGRRGDAVGLFMMRVGTPAEAVEGMKQAPMWPLFEAVAPTLAYDDAMLTDSLDEPLRVAAKVNVPTLIMTGTTIPFMHDTAKALEKAIPDARYRALDGQTHDVAADVMAPQLIEFFGSR
jgi:pimeloyl-ACP methyl ester carboxylesterase